MSGTQKGLGFEKAFKLLTSSGILAQEVQQKFDQNTWSANETFSQPTCRLLDVMFSAKFVE